MVIKLTEKELSQYRSLIREAEDLRVRINKLYDKEISTGYSTVRGSSKCFPYTEFRMSVWVDDPKEVEVREKLIKEYQVQLEQARKKALQLEQFISSIEDSELRRMFRHRFIDGLKLREIGRLMDMDFTGVSKKIITYLEKFQTNQQNLVI